MKTQHDLFLNRAWTRNGFDVHFCKRDIDGNITHVGKPLEMEPVKENSRSYEPQPPSFFLTLWDAQALADALWLAGVRPSEAKPTGDITAAMKDHITDLRSVVNKLFEKVD